MSTIHLVQCVVGMFPNANHPNTLHSNRTAEDMTQLEQVAQALTPDAWKLLGEQQRREQVWQTLTAAYDLPALEERLAALQPELDEARRQRKLLASRVRGQGQASPPVKTWRREIWGWWRRNTPHGSQGQVDQGPEVVSAQRKLEFLAREFTHLNRLIKARRDERWAQTFAGFGYQTVWLLVPATGANDFLSDLERRHGAHIWWNVPSLIVCCPVGIIPEDNGGPPDEREPRHWYFRSGLLALGLLGLQELAQNRQELEELEAWLDAEPVRASQLAAWLAGLVGP